MGLMSETGSAAPEAARTPPPEAYGKYYLVDKIAVGGMAEIFRAKTFGHGGFENLFVVKRILAHMSDNEQFVQMFLDEARVTALLVHANIVRVVDFGKIGTNYFLAMDYVEGKDAKLILRKLFERRKMLPREFAVYIAMEAAKGLDHAHRKSTNAGELMNIVHRDVSPSNVLVSYAGEVKVADFGIVQASSVVETTTKGTLKGKIEYMSPEQAMGETLDRRSDLFSLGVVLWEMLTGRRAFKTDNEVKTLDRVRNVDIERVSVVNPSVPARLSDIVARCMEKNPDDRYQDGRELHADLLNFLYPATPDVVQQSLGHFMQELFHDEIAVERDRLEVGTAAARVLHEAEPSVELQEDWEEDRRANSQPTVATGPAHRPASKLPLALGLAAMGVAAIAVTGSIFYVLNREPEKVVVEVQKEAPARATSLTVKVSPVSGTLFVDDVEAGQGAQILAEVKPGRHRVAVKADGYVTFTDEVEVAEGERLRLEARLSAVKAPEPPRAPSEAPAPTPPPPGTGTAPPPPAVQPTEVVIVQPPLPPAEKPKGKLNANVSGGWADVYVDGKKVGTTPLIGYALAAGTYQVRARNDAAGIDLTQTVTVKAGETAKASFSAQ
jgi:serine/threonine protein kinase